MDWHLDTFVTAFTAFFVSTGPIDVAAIFATITVGSSGAEKRAMAVKGVLIATGILAVFFFAGPAALGKLGITLPALRTAGGILLLLIAIDMVFARSSGGSSATEDERKEGAAKQDVSVFPLATPLIAGPGTMGAVVLFVADQQGDAVGIAAVGLALLAVLALTLLLVLGAARIQKLLGVTGLNVAMRVMGVLLSALAVQFIFDGLKGSGLFPA